MEERNGIQAFFLVPFLSGVPGGMVSMDSSGGRMYVGTAHGWVLLFVVEREKNQTTLKTRLAGRINLGLGPKPVTDVRVVKEFGAVLVLCDTILLVLNLFNLEITGRLMAGVQCFCLQSPLRNFRVAVALPDDKIQLLELQDSKGERAMICGEIQLRSGPTCLAWTPRKIFAGCAGEYLLVDVATVSVSPLFEITEPPMIRVLMSEVLLVSGHVGVLVTPEGRISRGSISWSATPVNIGYQFPYFIAVLPSHIEIHNAVNQALIQRMEWSQQTSLLSCSTLVLLASATDAYCLVPSPMEEQLRQLVDIGRAEEALQLAQVVWKQDPGIASKMNALRTLAGLRSFRRMDSFASCVEMIPKSSIDPRLLIGSFPSLLSSETTFDGTAQQCPTIDTLLQDWWNRNPSKGEATEEDKRQALKQRMQEAKATLGAVLQAVRPKEGLSNDVRKDIDTALMRLCLQGCMPSSSSILVKLLEGENFICISDAEADLTGEWTRFLGLVYEHNKMDEKALEVWKGTAMDALLETDGHSSIDFATRLLGRQMDMAVVWTHAEWVMAADPTKGVKIFTDTVRPPSSYVKETVDFLERHDHQAVAEYLEYLIFEGHNQQEDIHTKLILIYLGWLEQSMSATAAASDNVKSAPSGGGRRVGRRQRRVIPKVSHNVGEMLQTRARLQRVLRESRLYNVEMVLGRIGSTTLYEEQVVLYSRLGQHGKALDILVQKMKNFEAAVAYCEMGMRDSSSTAPKENLFLQLLHLYMEPDEDNIDAEGSIVSLPEQALQLLNTQAEHLPLLEVLKLLPSSIPVTTVEQFFVQAMRHQTHLFRSTMVERNLCKMENLQASIDRTQLVSQYVRIDHGTECAICKKYMGDFPFACYPNGVLVHMKCLRDKRVCPVTKRNFKENSSFCS